MCRKLFFLTSFVVVLSLVGNASGQLEEGKILFEYWLDIGGTAVSDLTSAAGYPDSPDQSELLDKFEGPVDWADNYGIRARGYLYPPADGDYTFWISGDDYIELYLSTDDDPANMALVAEVPGWTNHLEWGKYPEQQSAPITLAAGQKYYIEALMKEGGGGDSLTAAWGGPEIGAGPVVIYVGFQACKPIPADGAVDADVLTLEWTAGVGAVSHKVYLSTDATVDESDFLAEGPLTVQFADLAPGAAYYWRVDEVDADGAVIEGTVWSFSTLPIEAHFPDPDDGAEDVALDAQLSWTAGKDAILHDVYFGTDEAAVAASDPSTFQGKLMETSFDPGLLEPFMTYYWKVDEFAIIVTNPGPVWSFSTPKYLVIDDDETTLDYDNSAEPYVSEASWDTPTDLTTGGLADLTLRFHGAPGSEGSVSLDEATGTYSITGSGADVWGSSDQFHYGYRELTGDGEIVARVVDNGTGSNNWAKGGVMIRETLDADSKHTIMALTGSSGGGITFQGRPVTGERSNSMHDDITASPPHWVKLTREGNTITAYHSADGVTWELFTDTATDGDITNPWDVEMADPVLIGLFVTSHAAGEKRTYTFDSVDIVGDISADTASTDIGISGNDVEPLYVALEDSTGAVATVTHPYAAAVQIDAWRDWTIPLSKFTGVDPADAVKLYVGVGDGEPGGSGSISIDDIRVVMSATATNIVWVSDFYDDDGDGVTDDIGWVELLRAQGHTVDYTMGDAVGNGYWRTLDDAKIAALNAADLIIVSRCSDSGNYDDDDEVAQWNSVTTPIMLQAMHIVRSSRWRWLDTTSLPNLSDVVVEIVAADNPIFAGVASPVQVGDGLVGPTTYVDITGVGVGNGTLLAKVADADVAWIIEWEAGVEFYPGSGEVAGGPRMVFCAGTQDESGVTGRGMYNLTPEGLTIFLNAVNSLLPAVELDVTVPGDIVKGVPDDGDWPGAETPDLAIDDNTGTKFLHFKGETETSGIQVTPLNGPSIVTGLTFTTANDAAPRDPVAFELYGSNDSIDGPYELIASGDIVDFAQADAWPRFTKNETLISFDNDAVYDHYQVLFPAVRDAANANSMQIAEVELIGVPEPKPADVTAKGDAIQGVPNDGLRVGNDFGWPGAETPDLAIDDNKRTKFLHFKGELEPTGFQVTPSSGPTIVTGLTLTTANDATERDPVAFELSGSNESIDGPYELIASGDIVDFAQADVWPRFRMNATPISFDNTVAYAHYQVLFPAVRDAGSANSMQIAEVELIGLPAPAGPVAQWTLDDGEGTIAADSSGNGNDGVLNGEPLWAAGIIGGALELDGVDDYVDCGNPSMLDFGTGDFTISAWINTSAIERGTVYAKGGDNSGGIRYTLAMGEANDNQMTLTTDDDSSKVQAKGGTVVNDGAWHHVVGMRSGNTSLVYVDGIFDGSETLPEGYDLSGASQHNALIGVITDHRDPTGATLEKFFAGTIDDVRIYDRALSEAEILVLAGN